MKGEFKMNFICTLIAYIIVFYSIYSGVLWIMGIITDFSNGRQIDDTKTEIRGGYPKRDN